ncbi:unnamed protein product [Cylindrotheca closterium]|uniref:Uncharacterized protein n=1 Tax=Cylindrotheca closterium TaxID=2856 RepID=A0AAD2CC47_9STRA|nr:unnamed protein product [Cylindrotheca closterium]
MSSYSLYLCPTEKSLASAREAVPAVEVHLDAVEQKGDWGSKIHITLSSFAGSTMQDTKPKHRSNKMHPGNITKVVNDIWDAKISEGKPFHISEDKWDRGKKNKWGNLFKFSVSKECKTLENILKHVNKEELLQGEDGEESLQLVLLNPKETVNQLHVSFLTSSEPENDADDIRKFLSLLNWFVCIAELPEDREDGSDLQILSIPQAKIGD